MARSKSSDFFFRLELSQTRDTTRLSHPSQVAREEEGEEEDVKIAEEGNDPSKRRRIVFVGGDKKEDPLGLVTAPLTKLFRNTVDVNL